MALSFAEKGHEEVVKLLLAMDGTKVNSQSSGNAWWTMAGAGEEMSPDNGPHGDCHESRMDTTIRSAIKRTY